MPQLLENYKLGSADGVSLAFIGVWFIGDVTNLLGGAVLYIIDSASLPVEIACIKVDADAVLLQVRWERAWSRL